MSYGLTWSGARASDELVVEPTPCRREPFRDTLGPAFEGDLMTRLARAAVEQMMTERQKHSILLPSTVVIRKTQQQMIPLSNLALLH